MASFAQSILAPSLTEELPPVFGPVDPPRGGRDVDGWASWHTWSPGFRTLLGGLAECVDPSWPAPRIRELRSGSVYTRTFSLSSAVRRNRKWRALLDELKLYAASLVSTPKPSRVLLLTGLFDGVKPGTPIKFVLAALRQTIVELLDDEHAAYYAPLGSTGRGVGAFAAHSDLYVPDLLMNIFEEVPDDDSGASVFISAERFCQVLRETPSVPTAVELKVRALLCGELHDDCFDDFYKTLYGRGMPWAEDLLEAVARRQKRIVMRSGEGYFIHDRSWLHGREAPSCGVGANRLHRLVFQHAGSLTPARTAPVAGAAR
jgi:hypothetical protein